MADHALWGWIPWTDSKALLLSPNKTAKADQSSHPWQLGWLSPFLETAMAHEKISACGGHTSWAGWLEETVARELADALIARFTSVTHVG